MTTSQLSDNIGRRIVLILSMTLLIIGLIFNIFSYSYFTVAISRFVVGYSSNSACFLALVYITETVVDNQRQFQTVLANGFFGLGLFMNAVLFYLFGNYKPILIFFNIVPSIAILICLMVFVEETPQHLVRRYETQ